MMKVTNAFSLNMLASLTGSVTFREMSLEEARKLLEGGLESSVGHADTAAVYADVLGMEIPAVRSTVSLQKGDTVVIGQYRGPRMPEGTKHLPEGATIQWVLLTVG